MNTIKINLLPKQTLKRKALKTINIVAQVALVINMSMVGAIIAPQETGALANPSANLDQCANDPAPSASTDGCFTDASEWVNGNLNAAKSVYYEGDSIPYRMKFDNLTLDSHTVTIEWDTTKSGKHAIDYLTAYNQTVATADPTLGISGLPAATTFPIPNDPQVTGAGVTPIAGDFTLFGGTITAVSAYTYPLGAGFSGDKKAQITLTFTASVADPVLAWGGHISDRADWGDDNSAVAISGSPYHTRLIGLDGSGGNQDRSLAAEAVIYPASITVIKDAIPDGSQNFDYTTTGGLSPASFSLVDDGTAANTQTFPDLTNFSTYTVTESAPASWALNGIACVVTSPNSGSQTVNIPTVTIDLEEGENVTCTYTNELQGHYLKVIKHLDNDGDGVYEENNPAGWTWDLDNVNTNYDMGHTEWVASGWHHVKEDQQPGYHVDRWYCCNGTSGIGEEEFDIEMAKDLTCEFWNTRDKGELTVIKDVAVGPAAPSDWTMEVSGPENLSFPGQQNPGVTNTVLTGSYQVTESGGPAGYDLTYSGDCDANGNVTVGNNEHKTCILVNSINYGSLKVIKYVDSGSATPDQWDFTIAGIDTLSPVSGNDYVVFDNLSTGNYTVTESDLPGYHQVSTTCNDVPVMPDKQSVCYIHNTEDTGHIEIHKEVDVDGDGDIDLYDPVGWTWDLDYVDTNFPMGHSELTNVGWHHVKEDQHPGYTATAWRCNNGDSGTGEEFDVYVAKDRCHLECTFTNTRDTATLTLIKHVINDNGGTLDVSNFPLFIDTTQVTSGVAETVLAGVQYTVSETSHPDYQASVWSGDCAPDGTITLQAGENKVCHITNDDKPATLTLIKHVINDDGGTKVVTDFPLFIDTTQVTSGVAHNVAPGTYTASETEDVGYAASDWSGDCAADGTVSISLGEHKTCEITNDDISPQLTVVKHVINDNGGTAVATDFTMNVTGTNVSNPSFPGEEAPGVTVTLDQGSYSVDEVELFGYAKTLGADCSGTINVGESKTCTITNDDIAPTLTLIKHVINDNGGTKVVSDFPLFITALPVTSGVAETVMANVEYVASETEDLGYTASAWSGSCAANGTVTLLPGENGVCHITNDDEAPSITLIKNVINDNGGNALPNDFNLTIGGYPVSSGVSYGVDANTPYALDETQLPGYTFVSLTGDYKCPSVLGGTATLDEGEDITCTITNDDEQSYIIVDKTVINDNGGSAVANDFLLTVDGNSVLDEVAYPVNPGTHTAGETTLPGYTPGAWGGDCDLNADVTVALGETKTCTITNDDIAPELIVVKHVINDDGGTAVAADFTMNVTGTNVSNDSFAGQEVPGVTVTLDQGSYSVDEVEVDGYAKTLGIDCSGTINVGETKICGITNDDIAPTLTLVKTVINDNGGTKQVADFPLFITATQVASGVAETVMANVEYIASETEDADYTASDWGGDCAADGTITLLPGDNKTCTITNDDNPEEKVPDPILEIVKVVDKELVNPGDSVIYTVTVTNVGEGTAINVILTDTLPSGFTFADTGNATKTWELGDMESGDSVTKEYDVNVDSNQPAGFNDNFAETWADNHDKIDDVATVEVRIPQILAEEAEPELTINKTVDVTWTNPGKIINYKVVVTNIGDAPAINVELVDTLPTGFTFVDTGINTHTWKLGDLVEGEFAEITYPVQVDASVEAGDYDNLAVADADNTDPVSDTVPVQIRIPKVLGEALPDTGQSNLWYVVIGLMLLTAGLGITLYLKNSKDKVDLSINFLSLL